MADPEVDHGLVLNSQGEVDIIRSPFFDPGFGAEATVKEYVDRILPHLAEFIDEQKFLEEWKITRRLPVSPPPATNLSTKVLGAIFLVVISFFIGLVFLR
ncbi:hypothetical protein MA16_Dca025216 [Dendrobium catenatum]|uniref:Uncharacterized protein n=1 Tax=Dendrobium catenatum TaxID=906689 RepID=A0A2I0XB76_9ASPA|nr:hypothetical protein MA16_Dca025216 [Dendrobium catenatum]